MVQFSAPGIASGDISGIAVAELPWWMTRRYFPAKQMALIDDWEEKIALMAPASLQADIRTISGTPSWLLVFFERLAALRPVTSRPIAWSPERLHRSERRQLAAHHLPALSHRWPGEMRRTAALRRSNRFRRSDRTRSHLFIHGTRS